MSKLQLKDVTLFSIDAHNSKGMLRAAEICQREIEFGAVVLITERLFPGATREEGRRNYSEFIFRKLADYFTTSHVLIVSDDGYIQRPAAWDNSWLDLDVLGAGWEWYSDMQVGNGGFALRSKRLCDILATDPHFTETHPEDHHIGRTYRPYLEEKYGIKFGTIEQARKFSIEGWNLPMEKRIYNGSFGFHGFHAIQLPIPPKR